jgi:hypothetical protein
MCLMIQRREYGDNSLDITGPSLIGKVVNKYIKNSIHSGFSEGKDVIYGLKILFHEYSQKDYIKYKNKQIIRTYCTNDNKLLKLSGKEKYFSSWFKKRVYKKDLQ